MVWRPAQPIGHQMRSRNMHMAVEKAFLGKRPVMTLPFTPKDSKPYRVAAQE